MPDGTISLAGRSVSIQAQGLTLAELRVELREGLSPRSRRDRSYPGPSVNGHHAISTSLAKSRCPGRYEMTGPTTLMQALAMAGSWNVGAYLKQIVVFPPWSRLAVESDDA